MYPTENTVSIRNVANPVWRHW